MFQKTRDRKSIFFCFSILLMTGMVLLAGCGKQNTGKKNAAKQAAAHYRILVCQGTPTETFDPQALEKGFLDSLSSTLGEENLEVETFRITDPDDSRIKITQLLEQTAEDEPGFSLIFTEDAASLSAAAMSTSQVPIVSAGCLSIPDTLGAKYIDEDKQLTGRNVTGVSSQPPVDAQLSLLIEVTKNLENVGILYTPEDSDAIKQNRILESYLDEAHIPWKEYILPSKAYRKYLADEGDTENMNPLEAGTYGDPQIPLVSGSWKGPKGKKTEKNTDPRTFKTRLPRKASQKKILSYACRECSALFLPTGSLTGQQAEAIGKTATKKGVTTFGGDPVSGAYCLATLYENPYSFGTAAASIAVRILKDGENPAQIPVTTPPGSAYVKLYNKEFAKKFKLDLPKTFFEYSDYLKNQG